MLETAQKLARWALEPAGLRKALVSEGTRATKLKLATGGALRATLPEGPAGPHITRYAMYGALKKQAKHIAPGPVLSISHSEPLCKVLGIAPHDVTPANFPECNLLDLPFEDETFTTLVSDQVLEHVAGDPQRAIDESFRVLRPGGIAVHTTCFMNPVHMFPVDFWRFTPEGLRLLAKNYEVLATGGWGNKYLPFVEDLGLRFVNVPHQKGNWLRRLAELNDPTRPMVTWLVARKPGKR